MRTYHEWMKAVCLITMAGTPSLAVPAGFDGQDCPLGFQDHRASCAARWIGLKLAHAREQASDWTGKHLPPLLQA